MYHTLFPFHNIVTLIRFYYLLPIPFLINIFTALKVIFLFGITAAGVVPCGGPKKYPRTSFIAQIIFFFDPLRSAWVF